MPLVGAVRSETGVSSRTTLAQLETAPTKWGAES